MYEDVTKKRDPHINIRSPSDRASLSSSAPAPCGAATLDLLASHNFSVSN